MKRTLLLGLLVPALFAACTNLQTTSPEGVALRKEEAAINFANQRSAVQSWQADGRDGLWVQDARRDWYYATFIGPCEGLDHAIRLGFDTGTSDKLDRFSYVIVPDENQRCAISSFTKSEAPPEGRRRNLAGEEIR